MLGHDVTDAATRSTALPGGDEPRVLAPCEELLAELPPRENHPVTFLGRQYDLGLAWVHFPEGYGGLGLSPKVQKLVNETLWRAGAPHAAPRNPIGHGMGAPTVVTHGSDAEAALPAAPLHQRGDLVPALLRAGRRL